MRFGTRLTQYVIESGRRQKSARGAFTALLNEVATSCKRVAALVRRGELAGVLGSAGSGNVQGEEQKKLDVIANDVFIDSLQRSGLLAGVASEEMEKHIPIPEEYPLGDYLLSFDPLDGSSNIDINAATGTIFSILRHTEGKRPSDADFLQAGREQVCAGYCLYSSATMLVLSTGEGVAGFTLDNAIGEFLLTHPDIRIPADTREFAINASYRRHWHAPVRRYIEECEAGQDGPRGENFNMRWAGAMVGDVHRLMCRGGVFLYPSDAAIEAKGQAGKLRLLYEASPMGMLVEQAGGMAHTGHAPILDIQPDGLHQRVPVLLGSSNEVQRLVDYHREAAE